MKKRKSAGAGAAKTAPGVKIEAIFLRERRLTVSMGISSDFGKDKVGLALSENLREDEDVMTHVDGMYDLLEEKLIEKFEQLQGEEDSEVPEEEETFEDDEPDAEEEEEDDITEEAINTMKRPDLSKLIKAEELELDPKKFKKLADLRVAIIDALFEDDEETDDADASGDDEEWDDEEWDDE